MRLRFASALFFSFLFCAASGGAGRTALDAVQALPEALRKNLARIAAPEGNPEPQRWHILIYDSATENGLREYVVSDGQVVAEREVSQFAEKLSASDVIGIDTVRVNSDKLAAVAQQYAVANDVTVASMNFELRKEGATAPPMWKVGCVDSKGRKLGVLSVSADAGKIVSRDGFPNVPVEPVTQLELQPPAQSLGAPSSASAPAPQVVEKLPAVGDLRREENDAEKSKKKLATDAQRQPPKSKPRREIEARQDPVAELGEIEEERESTTPGPVAKRKAEPRKTRAPNVRRAIPVTEPTTTTREGAPETEPFYESSPRRVSPLRRAARWLIPF